MTSNTDQTGITQQPAFDRQTLCIAGTQPGVVSHVGDASFQPAIQNLYKSAESRALEQLTLIKAELRRSNRDDFWHTVCKGLADICGAEYAFVSRRIAAEKPDGTTGWGMIGEADSCLMALSWYFDDGKDTKGFAKDVQYAAFSCPCAYMKFEKTFIIPERYDDFIKDNPNAASILIPPEAYIAIPLFTEGECFAHFGLMWSKEAMQKRELGWPFVELICHALEDVILEGILDKPVLKVSSNEYDNVMIQRVAAASSSLRPHARSLSHELRTPMQGVMGMLDVIYATVQEEASTNSGNPRVRQMLEGIKDNIQMAQDSSRRASEAADNVVRAYDLNMGSVETQEPQSFGDGIIEDVRSNPISRTSSPRGTKRRRSTQSGDEENPLKLRPTDVPPDRPSTGRMRSSTIPRSSLEPQSNSPFGVQSRSGSEERTPAPADLFNRPLAGFQHTDIRDLCKAAVKESLRVGTRPESIAYRNTRVGQVIEVVTKGADGGLKNQFITWSTREAVPGTILVNERDLTKALSCVLQNAIKFTDEGQISLDVSLYCGVTSYIDFNVRDTGPGISKAFQREMFKPFSREDMSTTREKDGLGLGLLVAKGIAAKLGGNLVLVNSVTEGSNRGSEFRLRVPLSPPPSAISRGGSPVPGSIQIQQETPGGRQSHNSSFSSPLGHINVETSNSASGSPTTSGSLQPEESARRKSLAKLATNDSPTSSPNLTKDSSTVKSTRESTSPTSKFSYQIPRAPASNNISRPQPSRRRSSKFDRELNFQRDFAASYPLTFLVAEDNVINRRILVSMLAKLGYDPATQIYEAFDGADAVKQYVESIGGRHEVPETEPSTEESQPVKPPHRGAIDMVLMDLWMPHMSGYEAAEKILEFYSRGAPSSRPGARRSISEPQRLPTASASQTKPPPALQQLPTDPETTGAPLTAQRSAGHAPETSAVEIAELSSLDAQSAVPNMVPPTILAVTADATDGAAERAQQVGMQGIMVKPFKLKDLERLVREGWSRRTGGDGFAVPSWVESPV